MAEGHREGYEVVLRVRVSRGVDERMTRVRGVEREADFIRRAIEELIQREEAKRAQQAQP